MINTKTVLTALVGSAIIWFAKDYEGLRAGVSDLKLHFSYIKNTLEEIKTDVKDIKRSK